MKELDKNIAQKINELHRGILALLNKSVKDAIHIGELLTLKKAELKHGEFLPWVKNNLVFTDRSARNYMKLYENRERVIDAGNISQAYKMLEEPKNGNVSDLREKIPASITELIPARGLMTLIETDNPQYSMVFIFNQKLESYFKRFWLEKDSYDGITVVGDRRGISKEGLLLWLNITFKNIKITKVHKISEDSELIIMLEGLI